MFSVGFRRAIKWALRKTDTEVGMRANVRIKRCRRAAERSDPSDLHRRATTAAVNFALLKSVEVANGSQTRIQRGVK